MSLFNIGLSGLSVAQNSLTTVSHNMTNSTTVGYSRQNAIITTAGGVATSAGFLGQGAKTSTVQRVYDEFLTNQLRGSQTLSSSLGAYSDQISSIDNLLGDTTGGLEPLMEKYFAAVQAVSDTPSDTAARQSMLNAAQSLAGQIRSTSSYFEDQQTGINATVKSSVTQINAYTTQIAKLNADITRATASASGQPPNDLLDQRDQLISELNQVVGVKVVTQDSGTINIFVGNGQPLVMGSNSYNLEAVASSADPTRTGIAYVLPNGTKIEMADDTLTGGTLGGTLQYRSESLDTAQNSIGRLAASLAQSYNNQNKLGMDLNGNVGTDLFSIGSPLVLTNAKNAATTTATVTASIADANSLSTSDYELRFDGTNYNLVRLSDSKTVATAAATIPPTAPPTPVTLTADGLSVTTSGDGMTKGDSFQIQPTRQIADKFDSLITDPAKVAAAAPVKTTAGTTNTGTGTAKISGVAQGFSMAGMPITATYDSATSTYTFADSTGTAVTATPGATANDYVIGGVTISFGGTPAAGDQFTIGSNAGAVSDNSNVLAMSKLQTTKLIGGVSTFSDGYAILVNDIGSKAKSIAIAQTSQDSITTQVQTQQQSVSGVNLDEETVSMLRFQQLYQASSQVIKTASSLFDTLLSIA